MPKEYLWNCLETPPVSGRQLHHLRLQPVLSRIPGGRLRHHRRLVIRRYPARNAVVGEISCQVSNDCAYEVIVKMFGFRVGAYYMINTRRVFALVKMPCSMKAYGVSLADVTQYLRKY